MKRTTRQTSILVCVLLGVMVAGQAMAATLRYQASGNYNDILAVTLVNGWPAGGGGPGGLPGAADTIRCNWQNNLVTLTNVAPLINNFQLGVDESGRLEVDAGGVLYTKASSTVGNNNYCTGQLTVNTGGLVVVTNILFVCNGTGSGSGPTTGILTINGGTVSNTSHLWCGSANTAQGYIYITNGGSLTVGGNLGMGTINASGASGGKASVFVQNGGLLRLNQMNSVTTGTGGSIQSGSVLDISGSGVVTLPGNYVSTISGFTNVLRITAYGGLGTVGIDYNNTNVGKTTLFAIAPVAPPPTNVVWNPAANPSGTGKWNENANWTGGVRPATVTEVQFNVPGAIACTVTNAAVADHLDMGNTNVGGTLIITNGGSLTCGSATNATVIGDQYDALLDVENGGSASFAYQLQIGLNPGANGTLIMNGGTVSVADQFYLGYLGGTGTAKIHGGTLRLSKWDYFASIQGASVLDVAGTGAVVIVGDQQASVNNFISTGQITNSIGGTLNVDYNNINPGMTTIYPTGLYIPPAQVTWNPALNPNQPSDDLWNDVTNWTGGILPGNVTTVNITVANADPCWVTNAVSASTVKINGNSATLIITNGGNVTCFNTGDWCSIGYNTTGNLMDVEAGGSFSCAQHLWIGFATGFGTLVMNGGTVSVGQAFGLGYGGGTGFANINGGTLICAQCPSLSTASVLNITGTGTINITGNYLNTISNYVSTGQITNSTPGNVYCVYYPATNKTVVSAVPVAPTQQKITAISVSGGNVSITYQTTPSIPTSGIQYHIESTPSLTPPTWTPVTGSTNFGAGAPVTVTFPEGSAPMFYRTVSP